MTNQDIEFENSEFTAKYFLDRQNSSFNYHLRLSYHRQHYFNYASKNLI